jgi:hypothetical protein
MMNEMKLFVLLFAGVAAFAGDLAEVHKVYLLPLAGGLDLHLANRLTDAHIFQVVTDPKTADAVITDKLGPGFEDKMTELYPPPAPPKTESKDKDKDKDESKAKGNSPYDIGAVAAGLGGDTVNQASKRPTSSFGGGKGTIFLVSVKSREVIWATYAQPKDNRGEQLEKTAGKICMDLKKNMDLKKDMPKKN